MRQVILLGLYGMMVLGAGCVQKNYYRMPPLPGDQMLRAKFLPRVVELPQTQEARIVLEWENEPSPFSTNYLTGIEATKDFGQWQEMARVPFSTRGSFVITNPQPKQFFRVFNSIK